MKKLFQLILLISVIIAISNTAFSANEFFRSLATGNWNANATWEMSTNGGGTWFAATSTPTDTSGSITVRNPNTVTVTVSVTANQLTVVGSATLSVNTGIILTITDGSGEDLVVNNGGTVSGLGTVQSQGATSIFNIQSGANFTATLKINTGTNSSYSSAGPFIAIYKGTITVDAGATLTTIANGYTLQSLGNITVNGTLSANNSTFSMRGSTFTNNGVVNPTNLNFDTTTSLIGTGTYTPANIDITGSGNVSLSNNLTLSPTSTFNVNSGGILNCNTRVLTFNSGSFTSFSGSTIVASGTFQTQSNVNVIVRDGSNFNATLRINSGITTIYDNGGPFVASLKGAIITDAGATLTVLAGGYTLQANSTISNSGTISIGTGSTFRLGGSILLTNNGSITGQSFAMDSIVSIAGSGTYTCTSISIGSSGNVTLLNAVSFSPGTFTINSGGVLVPSSETYTFTSGTVVLVSGATVQGSGSLAGILGVQGVVTFDFRSGAFFNSAVRVFSGTLNAYNTAGPFIAPFNGAIIVDAGAVFSVVGGGYSVISNDSVVNNGTINGSGSTFKLNSASLINNGTISVSSFLMDSACSVSGSGTFSSPAIAIESAGNVLLKSNVTFSPVTSFTVNSGGILNPNAFIFTLNSGTFNLSTNATTVNSGTFRTQGTVNLNIDNSSNFNSPLKVNTGTTTGYNTTPPFVAIFKGTITVDAGAILNTFAGGFTIRATNTVTNNGSITASGSTFSMKGPSFINNNSVSAQILNFDSTVSLSGTGAYTSNAITIGSSGNVSLANNVTFTPATSLIILGGGILNPNTKIFTLANGTFTNNSGANVVNSGTFQTQGNINLNISIGSAFNAPLKVNTGTTYAYDGGAPFTARFNSPVTIDNGATLSAFPGGYHLKIYGNVTNNGTLSGAGSTIRFFGANFTNNGTVTNSSSFNFDSSAHTLQGTGTWTTNANIVSTSVVTLASNHKMLSVNIASGGTFNLSTFRLSLTASNPITNNGTFTTTNSAIEYNGTVNQSISTTNVLYNRLRINNPDGTTLPANINVADTLSVILGYLNLNGNIITISPTGYLSETPGNTVRGTSGYITTTRSINAPSSLNVAGFGAVLTTAVNLGSTEIRRSHAIQSGLGGKTSIARFFDITPTNNAGLNATLVFRYDESELNGWSETFLALYRSINSGIAWTLNGGTPSPVNNTITLTGIAAFSRWSATSTIAAAQVKLIMEGFYNTVSGKLTMRDTARVYLRNITPPYALRDSAKSIIDTVTFNGSFAFDNAPTGTYYLQLKHRNSLETWSDTGGVAYTQGSTLSYDFTTAAGKAFGGNMVQKGSKFCLYSGDVDQEGNIDVADVVAVFNDGNNFLKGYVRTDVNGDNFVDVADLLITYNNASMFISKITP